MFDLVLKNGLVFDPANAVYSVLNVGIKDGKIAALSDQPLEGKDERGSPTVLTADDLKAVRARFRDFAFTYPKKEGGLL